MVDFWINLKASKETILGCFPIRHILKELIFAGIDFLGFCDFLTNSKKLISAKKFVFPKPQKLVTTQFV